MAGTTRSIYIISDLHIGGAYGDPNAEHPARKRGFRMMDHAQELADFIELLGASAVAGSRELVINGDFVDFLAEEHEGQEFRPFLSEPGAALRTFEIIVARKPDRKIFDALAAFTALGHQLTIVLGNHDVELSLPDVRAELVRRVAPSAPARLRFVYDGEALVYGDALIEHGNAYDPANVVNHEALTRIRGLRSRGYPGPVDRFFTPPPGSRLVASVMNPIKANYGFIDLLKPESEPLFALLLAIAPEYRKELARAARALKEVPRNLLPRFGLPSYLANVGAAESTDSAGPISFEQAVADDAAGDDAALLEILASSVGDDAQDLLEQARALEAEGSDGSSSNEFNVASGWDRFKARLGLVRLFVKGKFANLDQRLGMVQSALRALVDDQTFADDVEPSRRYLEAAEQLTSQSDESNFRYVIFGHTHHAKDVQLESGARYLNTGTWANLMQFPAALLDPDKGRARDALRAFIQKVSSNDLGDYISFRPTYVRLELEDEQRVTAAELRTFDGKTV